MQMEKLITILFIIFYAVGGVILENGFGFESPAFFSFYGFCCAVFYFALSAKKIAV